MGLTGANKLVTDRQHPLLNGRLGKEMIKREKVMGEMSFFINAASEARIKKGKVPKGCSNVLACLWEKFIRSR